MNTSFYSCKKKPMHSIFTKINRIRPTATCNIHTKYELNWIRRLDAIVFTHTHTYTHTDRFQKTMFLDSRDLKTFKLGRKFWPKTIIPFPNVSRVMEVKIILKCTYIDWNIKIEIINFFLAISNQYFELTLLLQFCVTLAYFLLVAF